MVEDAIADETLGVIKEVHFKDLSAEKFYEKNFSNWLARKENLDFLSKVIGDGMELKFIKREKRVKGIKIDILCENVGKPQEEGEYVVIENQLTKSDHRHLGQLLAYAMGQQATTCIWVAASFKDYHLESLDWLNKKTDDSISFFGVEVKLYSIDGSKPVPVFQLVKKPYDESRSEIESEKEEHLNNELPIKNVEKFIEKISHASIPNFYKEYWTKLMAYMNESEGGFDLRVPAPSARYFQNIFSMKSGLVILYAMIKQDRITIDLYIRNEEMFQKLQADEEEIKSIIEVGGDNFEFKDLEHTETSRILLEHRCNPKNNEEHEIQFAWFKEKLEKFNDAFRSRIENINVYDYDDEDDE